MLGVIKIKQDQTSLASASRKSIIDPKDNSKEISTKTDQKGSAN